MSSWSSTGRALVDAVGEEVAEGEGLEGKVALNWRALGQLRVAKSS
jgi:hypothetical protein